MTDDKQKQIIVLVDDESELLDLYKLRLKSLDCIILSFEKPHDFLNYLKEHKDFIPDLVITDFMMPGMTGVEMLKSAIEFCSEFPSILLSGYIDKQKAIDATNNGIWNILEKPVQKEQLIDLTKKLLLQSHIRKLSFEIRSITSQLTEIFSAFRLLCIDEMELESMKKPILIQDPSNPNAIALSLEESLVELEKKLNNLVLEEKEIIKKAA